MPFSIFKKHCIGIIDGYDQIRNSDPVFFDAVNFIHGNDFVATLAP